MASTERRDERIPVNLKIRFKSATVSEFVEKHANDLSQGGIFIRTPKPMPPGTLIKFDFRLEDDSSVIQGVGRVVWIRKEGEEPPRPAGMGIKFIKLDEQSRQNLSKVLQQRVSQMPASATSFSSQAPAPATEDGDFLAHMHSAIDQVLESQSDADDDAVQGEDALPPLPSDLAGDIVSSARDASTETANKELSFDQLESDEAAETETDAEAEADADADADADAATDAGAPAADGGDDDDEEEHTQRIDIPKTTSPKPLAPSAAKASAQDSTSPKVPWVLVLIILAVVAAAGLYFFVASETPGEAPQMPPPPPADVLEAQVVSSDAATDTGSDTAAGTAAGTATDTATDTVADTATDTATSPSASDSEAVDSAADSDAATAPAAPAAPVAPVRPVVRPVPAPAPRPTPAPAAPAAPAPVEATPQDAPAPAPAAAPQDAPAPSPAPAPTAAPQAAPAPDASPAPPAPAEPKPQENPAPAPAPTSEGKSE
ncbi:MAG: TIGR02266 family protein [Proteobacteria bacterium]|nr:TIGR02266 family protein [Pseudomonadota bacterium]